MITGKLSRETGKVDRQLNRQLRYDKKSVYVFKNNVRASFVRENRFYQACRVYQLFCVTFSCKCFCAFIRVCMCSI